MGVRREKNVAFMTTRVPPSLTGSGAKVFRCSMDHPRRHIRVHPSPTTPIKALWTPLTGYLGSSAVMWNRLLMDSVSRLRSWLSRPRVLISVGLAVCYALVLFVPYLLPTAGPFGRTFNSMLEHLLQGRYDVDPAIVGKEGFARQGHVYAYWGPLPAILRLPVIWLPSWRQLDFTIPYCAVALIWMVAVKLWTVRFVLRHRPTVPRPLARAMYVVLGLSGAQICFLRFSLYQEVCLWAGLFGAIFVAAAIVAQHRGLGSIERLIMALAAGAALLTRVSTGIGLIAAFGCLLIVQALADRARWRSQLRMSVMPVLALTAAGLVAAWVNYSRWGDPFTFADYQYYLFNLKYPDRIARTATYGLFNLERIPFGINYYFFPAWSFQGSDGHLLFDATRVRLIDSAELPPSSFFLTDPMLLLLGVGAIVGWSSQRKIGGKQGAAIAAGLAIPPMLMLTAISMCFRYRIDFYPLIEFLAFSGLAMAGPSGWAARPRIVWALASISVACSVLACVAYLAGKLGPGQLLIGRGVGQYYLGRLGLQ